MKHLTEEQLYNMLQALSLALHKLEASGVMIPPDLDEAWGEITAWLESL
jgi:hypothetical protein